MNVPLFCVWLVTVTEWLVVLLPWVLGVLMVSAAGVGVWVAVDNYITTGGTADG